RRLELSVEQQAVGIRPATELHRRGDETLHQVTLGRTHIGFVDIDAGFAQIAFQHRLGALAMLGRDKRHGGLVRQAHLARPVVGGQPEFHLGPRVGVAPMPGQDEALLCGIQAANAAEVAPDLLLKKAQAEQKPYLATVKQLVDIDTGTGQAAGLKMVSAVLVERLSVETSPATPSAGDNIVGTIKGTGSKSFLLMIHYDTVFGPGTAAKRPFRVDAERAYGPGVADAKGGVAMVLHTLQLLKDEHFKDFGTLTVLFNPDEETGSAGSKTLIAELARKHDYVFSFEPPDKDAVTVATNGINGVFVDVKGKSSHAGSAPEAGRNAAMELAHQLVQLKDLGDPAKGTTVNWTLIKGGEKRNIIPSSAAAEDRPHAGTDCHALRHRRRLRLCARQSKAGRAGNHGRGRCRSACRRRVHGAVQHRPSAVPDGSIDHATVGQMIRLLPQRWLHTKGCEALPFVQALRTVIALRHRQLHQHQLWLRARMVQHASDEVTPDAPAPLCLRFAADPVVLRKAPRQCRRCTHSAAFPAAYCKNPAADCNLHVSCCGAAGAADGGDGRCQRRNAADPVNQQLPQPGSALRQCGLGNAQAEGQKLLGLINDVRKQPQQCGGQPFAAAAPLVWNDTLMSAAESHSRSMANNNYFDHKGRNGGTPGDRAELAGYIGQQIGENIAAGQDNARKVVEGWLASPGHCANLMNPQFHDLGAAYAVDPKSDAGIYWTALFGVQ
nr:hypothetical protein [Tanacetum cinerariifolium]